MGGQDTNGPQAQRVPAKSDRKLLMYSSGSSWLPSEFMGILTGSFSASFLDSPGDSFLVRFSLQHLRDEGVCYLVSYSHTSTEVRTATLGDPLPSSCVLASALAK